MKTIAAIALFLSSASAFAADAESIIFFTTSDRELLGTGWHTPESEPGAQCISGTEKVASIPPRAGYALEIGAPDRFGQKTVSIRAYFVDQENDLSDVSVRQGWWSESPAAFAEACGERYLGGFGLGYSIAYNFIVTAAPDDGLAPEKLEYDLTPAGRAKLVAELQGIFPRIETGFSGAGSELAPYIGGFDFWSIPGEDPAEGVASRIDTYLEQVKTRERLIQYYVLSPY